MKTCEPLAAPNPQGWGAACLKRLGKVLGVALLTVAVLASDLGAPRAQGGETAEDIFHNHISEPIVQSRCVNCHVQGGLSGHTRLVFVRRSAASEVDYEALNLGAFENLLDDLADEGGGSYILNKIQGVSHGGGVQVPAESADFANMQRFLGLLGQPVTMAKVTPDTLFDTVVLASNRKTLRRAALIFAGRIPTDAEYAAVESGGESALRTAVRGLMSGPQFHEFLIRASNDRLLTDRDTGGIIDRGLYFVEYTEEHYRRKRIAHIIDTERGWEEFRYWQNSVRHGARRAPLELIAYVAENDRPYTEILTADYIMANPMAAEAYGASTDEFDDPSDIYEFKPSSIVSYYRRGDDFESEYDPEVEAERIISRGSLSTDYPHAGILNTTIFLQRYPTTATNRNRARARWTYYHFLGLDVEKSASRTTDPDALSDTNNPTMHNPACTVCHSVLDPVAGAFQNYGDEGMYKDQWGGLDSLDRFYKEEPGPSLVTEAGSWEERETLSFPLTLLAGDQTLRVMFANPAGRDDNDGAQRYAYLDRLQVLDAAGDLLVAHEFERLGAPVAHWGPCGEVHENRAVRLRWGGDSCPMYIDIEVPETGFYTVEIVVWSVWNHRRGNRYFDGEAGFAEFSVVANAYEEGDTWYGNMRFPGFAGEEAPFSDNSLQWLARRIVADDRFATATVRFWWPAIMGSEVAEPPEDATDVDFEGRLLAANAQGAEVERLADGFRNGFPGSFYTYNLKDLLTEIVLSKWFRADVVTDANPVRRVALHDAGAKRLLTPEELDRKTAALTGVQWGRHSNNSPWNIGRPLRTRLTNDFRLLYGGIDSDGITERARDITSVMAGVAKRHAARVSCPVVMREVYLLPDEERRLFAGVDPYVTPVSEFSDTFEINAESRVERETLSLQGHLTAGAITVSLAFINDFSHETRGNRNVLLDSLTVRQGDTVVFHFEMENLAHRPRCHHIEQNAFHLNGSGRECVLAVPVDIPAGGEYRIEVVAWGDHAGDELPMLHLMVESDTESSVGAAGIRDKLVELHDKLLGLQVEPDSPDVEAAYRLFVNTWQRGRATLHGRFDRCVPDDHFYLEGILDNAVTERVNDNGHRYLGWDWDRIHDFLDDAGLEDPHHTVQAWVIVLADMMMDYRYLYL